MNQNDDKLSALLKQWRDIEPSPDFEGNVRRRILRPPGEAERRDCEATPWFWRWVAQKAVSVAAALAVGVVAGSVGGFSSVERASAEQRHATGFLSPDTLAGGYLRLTSGGEW